MGSGFMGLEIGKRALMAQQGALDVIGHNVANVNTPGYSRQEAVLTATEPSLTAAGYIGTGVAVTDIRRIRDAFIDLQVRTEMKKLGQYDMISTALEEVEVILNEPSDSGIRTALDQFWSSLQELNANPESDAVRKTVRERAVTLCVAITHTYRQLSDLQWDTDASIRSKVTEINTYASQIAELNSQITKATAAGDHPNDLMDRRDLLLDKLSRIVDIRVTEDVAGWSRVTIGGVPLVEVQGASEIAVQQLPNGYAQMVWANSGLPVNLSSGEMMGHFEVRDNLVEQLKADLNALASSIISEVNAQHALGFDYHGQPGGAFFQGTDARSIAVDDAILNDVALIAASSTGLVGSGGNALAMAQLKQKLTMQSDPSLPPNATWDDFLRGVMARVGVDSEHATKMAENEESLITEIENRRQSVSGVSLDEEMTNMIRYQHAYAAAARLITTADEMLEVLINRTGITGR